MSLHFLDLRDKSGRNVSFAIASDTPQQVNLLGVIPHQTEFDARDLVRFARAVIAEFNTIKNDHACYGSVACAYCDHEQHAPVISDDERDELASDALISKRALGALASDHSDDEHEISDDEQHDHDEQENARRCAAGSEHEHGRSDDTIRLEHERKRAINIARKLYANDEHEISASAKVYPTDQGRSCWIESAVFVCDDDFNSDDERERTDQGDLI